MGRILRGSWLEMSTPPPADSRSRDRLASELDSEQLLKGQNLVLERIAQAAPLTECLDLILRLVESQSPGLLASILTLDPDGVHVHHAAAPSLSAEFVRCVDGEPIGPRAGSCGTAIYRREPVVVEDIETDPLWQDYRDLALSHGLRACWSTPIFDEEQRVLGSFAMYFRAPGRPAARDWQLIELSTHLAAVAIVRHRESEALARREAVLLEAQRIAHLGSYEWDVRSNVVSRSEELCRIFGLLPHQFAPTFEAYLERVHPEDRATTRATIERAARDLTSFEFEERIVRPDGTLRRLLSQGKWVFDESGVPLKMLGICHDVTERKQAEDLLRRSEERFKRQAKLIQALARKLTDAEEQERRRLAHELHDDIGQRLTALKLMLQMNEAASGAAAPVIHECVLMADRLLADVRAFARGLKPALLEEAGPAAAIRALLELQLPPLRIDLKVAVPGEVPRLPFPIEVAMYRILQESIANALRHSDARRITFVTTVENDDLVLTVGDDGSGFDVADALRTAGGGSHLGLVGMHERATFIDAALDVRSSPGRGTTVRLVVPLVSRDMRRDAPKVEALT